MSESPDASFPAAMRSEGQLEALYRFINNDKVSFDRIRAPHVDQTTERCRDQEEVLVLHDTTSLEFGGKREGLGRLETSASGFFLHASLAEVSPPVSSQISFTRPRGKHAKRSPSNNLPISPNP